jgi:hypothetical protein
MAANAALTRSIAILFVEWFKGDCLDLTAMKASRGRRSRTRGFAGEP